MRQDKTININSATHERQNANALSDQKSRVWE